MQAVADDRSRKLRKFGLSALVGGLAGFAGAVGVLEMEDAGVLGELSGSQVAALLVALIYMLMGVFAGIGTVSPRLGAQFLNVEDAEELAEERAMLVPSAISCILLSLALVALALAGVRAMLSPTAALAIVGVAIIAATWPSLRSMHSADELMRDVMREGASASFYLGFAVIGGWAMLAHLGFVAAPAMLDVISLIYALTLIGCFWVIGRRGMMIR